MTGSERNGYGEKLEESRWRLRMIEGPRIWHAVVALALLTGLAAVFWWAYSRGVESLLG